MRRKTALSNPCGDAQSAVGFARVSFLDERMINAYVFIAFVNKNVGERASINILPLQRMHQQYHTFPVDQHVVALRGGFGAGLGAPTLSAVHFGRVNPEISYDFAVTGFYGVSVEN